MTRIRIRPTDLFDRPALEKALGLRASSITREIREKRLRAFQRCGRQWFIGQDVLDWITGAPLPRGEHVATEQGAVAP